LASGDNLWTMILALGLYDTIDFIRCATVAVREVRERDLTRHDRGITPVGPTP
jgi:hypothetical protein